MGVSVEASFERCLPVKNHILLPMVVKGLPAAGQDADCAASAARQSRGSCLPALG